MTIERKKKSKFNKIFIKPTKINEHTLVLPSRYHKTSNYIFITKHLINSGIFSKIEYKNFSTGRFYKFIIDGQVCLIDYLDKSKISENYILRFPQIFKDVKFIFILQFCQARAEYYKKISQNLDIHILPFIYSPIYWFPLSQFTWKDINHKYIANFCFGLSRKKKHRKRWIEKAQQNGNFLLRFTQGEKYLETLKECKWGISLKGAGYSQDGKCYRETEYLSLGMPLALAYKPCYAYPFAPGIDYVYLNNVEMLDTLSEIDPKPFAKKSKLIWEKYYSPSGLSKLLISIIHNEQYRNTIPNFWLDKEDKKQKKLKIDIKLK